MGHVQSNQPDNLGAISDSGLIRSEARLVLTGIRHDTVSAHAKDYAAQCPKTLRPPILRRSRLSVAWALGRLKRWLLGWR